jgi:hypothetical protein
MESMVIQGRPQRFCQQCGRFHDCTEFEGTRKSCRRKLERHNERRRNELINSCAWQGDSEEEKMDIDATEDAEYQVVANMKRGARSRPARLRSLNTPSSNNVGSSSRDTEPYESSSLDERGGSHHSRMNLDSAGFLPFNQSAMAGGDSAEFNYLQPQHPSFNVGGTATRDGLPIGLEGAVAGSTLDSPNALNPIFHASATGIAPLNTSSDHPDPQELTPFGIAKDYDFFPDIPDDNILGDLLMPPVDSISNPLEISTHDQCSGNILEEFGGRVDPGQASGYGMDGLIGAAATGTVEDCEFAPMPKKK